MNKCFVALILGVVCTQTIVHSERVSEKACTQYSKLSDLSGPVKVRRRRIVGGESSTIGEFPFMAALGYYGDNGELSFSCGGVVVSDSFVITAAHCVTNRNRPDRVFVGHLKLTDVADNSGDLYKIESIVRHPEYSTRKKKNDIALIQLVERVRFSDTIKPVCLETDVTLVDSSIDVTIAGWGKVSDESNTQSDTLLKAKLKTMPLPQCNLLYSKIFKGENEISESQLCAHDPNAMKDSCNGDAGGPALKINSDGTPTKLVGIVSFGVSCGSTHPGIYTRVAFYIDWIESIVWPDKNHIDVRISI